MLLALLSISRHCLTLQVGAVTGAVGSVTGAVGSVTGAVGSVTGAVGSVTGAVGSIAAGGITALLATAIHGSHTIGSALRAILHLFGGKSSGFVAGSGTGTLRDIGDGKNVATKTISSDGNVTAVSGVDLT